MTELQLPWITDAGDLQGKRVLLRASLNVPLEDGEVRNAFRLKRAQKTITFLAEAGARVVIIGHIGRTSDDTLRPVYDALAKDISLSWRGSVDGDSVADAVASLEDGEALLLENVRSDAGETANDSAFAEMLARYGDIYVNDAFADSHRAHASIVGVPRLLPSYFGLLFQEEYRALTRVRTPISPSVFILGGAKFATKEPLIQKFLDIYDTVFVGGALANEFFKAQGLEVGTSVIEDGKVPENVLRHPHIRLPERVIVEDSEGNTASKSPGAVLPNEKILDAFAPDGLVDGQATILWNGPLGHYEGGYDAGTIELAEYVAGSGTNTVVGGGDTVAAIERLGLNEKIGFISTAGGAMLTFLQEGTLPGIDAVMKR